MNGEGWLMDRLHALYGADYDLITIPGEGVEAVPHETGRDPLTAHSAIVLGVLLSQAAGERAHGEPALSRCQRDHERAERIHEAREARR